MVQIKCHRCGVPISKHSIGYAQAVLYDKELLCGKCFRFRRVLSDWKLFDEENSYEYSIGSGEIEGNGEEGGGGDF